MTGGARAAALAAALAGLMSDGARADVPVRSGEHATFTRLVFADGRAEGWTASRPDAGIVVLDGPDAATTLDLGAVFARIPRGRIVDATAEPGRLVLTLGCDCPVEVSRIASGHVVIDVTNGPPLPAGRPHVSRRISFVGAAPNG